MKTGSFRVRSYLLAAVVLASALQCRAQLKMALTQEVTEMLRYEPVHVQLALVNDSTGPFVLNPEKEGLGTDLTFMIERTPGRYNLALRKNDGPLVGTIRLLPEARTDVDVDLAKFFDLSAPGQYMARAVVDMNGRSYSSNKVVFDIVTGVKLAGETRIVPGTDRKRTYTLRYWTRERVQHLFLCVEEQESNTNYGVFPLGPVVLMKKAVDLRVHGDGRVEVVHQARQDCFARSVFLSRPEGMRLVDQSFRREDGSPYARNEVPEQP